MRHYIAVQDPDTGRWFYANEGRNRQTGRYGWTPSGACGKWKLCDACEGRMTDVTGAPGRPAEDGHCVICGGRGVVEDPNRCEGHETEAQAYEHEKQRILKENVRFHADQAGARSQHRCEAEGCSAFTSGSARAGAYRRWSLCEAHRTADVVAGLLSVGESWES